MINEEFMILFSFNILNYILVGREITVFNVTQNSSFQRDYATN